MNLRITCQTIHIDFFVISFIQVSYRNLNRKINGVGLLGIQDTECYAVLRYVEHSMPLEIRPAPA